MSRPSHHLPNGRFRNPWPEASGDGDLRGRIGRVAFDWIVGDHPPDPKPGELPVEEPAPESLPPDAREMRITWIGHATFLVQLPGLDLLTDPVWSERASPVGFAGPKRFVPPPLDLDSLPRPSAILLSHDHYDHLDRSTVVALRRRFGDSLSWRTPLGYRRWFRRLGVESVVECDWWQETVLPGGRYRAIAVPARHWTRRSPWETNRRLWCGWIVEPTEGPGPRLVFVGDSGACSVFGEIGDRHGPFDVSLVPIGAYEPRWFMAPAHMSPEEAVGVYGELGGKGAFVGMHWGTWRLTFEDPLEPPRRTLRAWQEAGLDPDDLHLPRHGETLVLPATAL